MNNFKINCKDPKDIVIGLETMTNYEKVKGCNGENHNYFVSRNYQVFVGKTLVRQNLMHYTDETKNKFIISNDCLPNCKNPCRVLKFDQYKCLPLKDYKDDQIKFIKQRMTEDTETFECFIKRHVSLFKKYWSIKKIEDDFLFSENESVIKPEWIPNSENKEILIDYVLRKSLENVYTFEKSININEFFIILLTELLKKLDFDDLEVLSNSNYVKEELFQNVQTLHSWSAKKHRRNALLLINVASNVLSICSNCDIYVLNREKALFDNDYLSSLELEKEFYKLEKIAFEHTDQYSLMFPKLVKKKADMIEYFKICNILKLDHISVGKHETMNYSRLLTDNKFINLNATDLKTIINTDIPRLAVTSHPLHTLLFGDNFEKKYRLLYIHYKSLNRKRWFNLEANVGRSTSAVVRNQFTFIQKKELSFKNSCTTRSIGCVAKSSKESEHSLKELIEKFKAKKTET